MQMVISTILRIKLVLQGIKKLQLEKVEVLLQIKVEKGYYNYVNPYRHFNLNTDEFSIKINLARY